MRFDGFALVGKNRFPNRRRFHLFKSKKMNTGDWIKVSEKPVSTICKTADTQVDKLQLPQIQ